jgi:hypothetical protein
MRQASDGEKEREELQRELQGLLSDWLRISQKLTLKVRARFREVEWRLARRPGSVPCGPRELRQALTLTHKLRIKPDKARAKDLLRIEGLLDELAILLPEDER